MADDKMLVFNAFAEKAKKRIEERKKYRTRKYYVKSMDVEITLHGLTEQEISECSEMFESSLESDKYIIYTASPELQEASGLMVFDGSLKETERYKITEMFSYADRNYLAKEILTLSGIYEKAGIEPVDEVKEIKN